jgi:hypothetical protein
MTGYSGTPLAQKLGIKEGLTVYLEGAPADYPSKGATVARSVTTKVDLIHLFTRSAAQLDAKLRLYRRKIRDDAVVWVSWPKKASKVQTDITEDTIREIAIPLGYVDIKVCAVDDVWSGLKLVIRRENRATKTKR